MPVHIAGARLRHGRRLNTEYRRHTSARRASRAKCPLTLRCSPLTAPRFPQAELSTLAEPAGSGSTLLMMSTARKITTDDLMAMGLSPGDIATRVRQGGIVRLRRGVYSLPDVSSPESQQRRLIAAGRTVVADSNVISHVSAGALQGLPVPRKLLDVISMTRFTPDHGELSERMRVRRKLCSRSSLIPTGTRRAPRLPLAATGGIYIASDQVEVRRLWGWRASVG